MEKDSIIFSQSCHPLLKKLMKFILLECSTHNIQKNIKMVDFRIIAEHAKNDNHSSWQNWRKLTWLKFSITKFDNYQDFMYSMYLISSARAHNSAIHELKGMQRLYSMLQTVQWADMSTVRELEVFRTGLSSGWWCSSPEKVLKTIPIQPIVAAMVTFLHLNVSSANGSSHHIDHFKYKLKHVK